MRRIVENLFQGHGQEEQLAATFDLQHNWVAGFCRYYGQPVISRDRAFDRVQGLRRLTY